MLGLPGNFFSALRQSLRDRPLSWIRPAVWLGVLLLAFILRLQLLRLPYWYDEALTLHYVRQEFPRMLQLVFADLHVPVYYAILFAWIRLVGQSSVMTGALSFLLGCLTVGVVYRLGKEAVSQAAGVLAAALYWVSWSAIFYSTETRMYQLLAVWASLAALLLLRWARGSSAAGWWWVGINTLGFATHVLYVFFIFGQLIVMALWLRRGATAWKPRRVMACLAALALASLPVMGMLLDDFVHWYLVRGNWFARGVPTSFARWVDFFLQRPPNLFYSIYHVSAGWMNSSLWLFALLVILTPLGSVRVQRFGVALTLHRLPYPLQGIILLAVTPLVLLVLFRVPVDRYISYTVVFWSVWLAAGFQQLRIARWRAWAPLLFAVALLAVHVRLIRTDIRRQPDFRWPEIMQRLQHLEDPRDQAVVLVNSYDWAPIAWEHYRGRLPVQVFFPPSLARDGDIELAMFSRIGLPTITRENVTELAPQMAPFTTVWLVNTGAQSNTDPDDAVQQFLYSSCRLNYSEQIPTDFISGHPYELKHFTDCRWR